MLNQFPDRIKAGLSFLCFVRAPDYLAPDWTLTAYLRGTGTKDIVAEGDGETHTFRLTSATTAELAPGQYAYTIRASDGTDVFEVESGTLDVVADLKGAAEGHDTSTHAQRVLASIEAVIEGRASKDQQSYTINGRTLVRTPIAELMEMRKLYRKEARQERRGRKKLVARKIKVRM